MRSIGHHRRRRQPAETSPERSAPRAGALASRRSATPCSSSFGLGGRAGGSARTSGILMGKPCRYRSGAGRDGGRQGRYDGSMMGAGERATPCGVKLAWRGTVCVWACAWGRVSRTPLFGAAWCHCGQRGRPACSAPPPAVPRPPSVLCAVLVGLGWCGQLRHFFHLGHAHESVN